MMWLMRRPRIRRFRQNWVHYVPEKRRDAAWNSFRAQERWARKWGLITLTWMLRFIAVFFAFNLIGAWIYTLQAEGILTTAR